MSVAGRDGSECEHWKIPERGGYCRQTFETDRRAVLHLRRRLEDRAEHDKVRAAVSRRNCFMNRMR